MNINEHLEKLVRESGISLYGTITRSRNAEWRAIQTELGEISRQRDADGDTPEQAIANCQAAKWNTLTTSTRVAP